MASSRSARVRLYPDDLPLPQPRRPTVRERQVRALQTRLSRADQVFCRSFAQTHNRALAAMQAGYRPVKAAQEANQLLQRPEIKAEIARLEAQEFERIQISGEAVMRRLAEIGFADWRQAFHVRTTPCRYCWGDNHEFQRTPAEMNADLARHMAKRGKGQPFDTAGGEGYDPSLPPNPQCPECRGDGVPDLVVRDSRDLPAPVAALIAGVEQTRYGVKIKLHNQLDALRTLAQIWLDMQKLKTPLAASEIFEQFKQNENLLNEFLALAANAGLLGAVG